MNPIRILSLDISSKTGYCCAISSPSAFELVEYGQVPQVPCPDGEYPVSFVDWANEVFDKILGLINKFKPDHLVIEETTSNSKSSHSQKILEFIHFLVAKFIKETGIATTYILTGQWRSLVESKMTKEEKIHNKQVSNYKKEKGTSIAYNEQGKRIGKITKKHVSIRKVKELFDINLKLKDNDLADGILISYAWHLRRMKDE